MRHSIVATLLLTVGLLFPLLPSPTASAGTVPTTSEQRETMRTAGFPDAADLGPGWTQAFAYANESTSAFPFDHFQVSYGETYGSRIAIWVVAFDGKDGQSAFDEVADRVSLNNTTLVPSDLAPSARELRDLDDPTGCDEVERANGEDPVMYYFTGIVGCLDSANDRAIWVAVSGVYDGDTFQDAAEAVLEIVLDTEPR